MSEKKVFRLSLDVIWIRIIAESVRDYIQINLPIGLNTLEWNLMERKQRLLRNVHFVHSLGYN